MPKSPVTFEVIELADLAEWTMDNSKRRAG